VIEATVKIAGMVTLLVLGAGLFMLTRRRRI
jgi:LPXTG-motif cell wall-anchored protein